MTIYEQNEHKCTACCFDRQSCDDRMNALKELLQKGIRHEREYFEAKIQGIEKSLSVAADVLKVRLDTSDEFRSQLGDRINESFTRPEHDLFKDRVDSDIRELRESKARIEGRTTMATILAALAAMVALMDGVLRFAFNK